MFRLPADNYRAGRVRSAHAGPGLRGSSRPCASLVHINNCLLASWAAGRSRGALMAQAGGGQRRKRPFLAAGQHRAAREAWGEDGLQLSLKLGQEINKLNPTPLNVCLANLAPYLSRNRLQNYSRVFSVNYS